MSDHARHSKLPSTFRLAERIRNGASKPDMAAQYGVSVNTPNRHLLAAGWNSDGTVKAEERAQPFAPRSEQALVAGPGLRIPEGVVLACQQFPDAWFPEKDDIHHAVQRVKKLCDGCPIREQCLEFAVVHDDIQHGVWGGASFREITKIRANRRAAA